MPYYRSVGDVPRKRHTLAHRNGGYLAEELMGEDGFSAASSLLYHLRSPSAIVSIEAVATEPATFAVNEPLRPHHLRTSALGFNGVTDALHRRALLGNEDVRISYVLATATSPLYRNAVGAELAYVQSGAATLESVFGRLRVRQGDYVVIPTSATHRWVIDSGPVEMLVIEGRGHIDIPSKYVTARGQLLEGAPFSERDLRAPEAEPLLIDGEEVPVLVRTRTGLTQHVHATHPFDVVGWDGCIYPWAFNIADFEPIVGRLHQPPPVHQTFAGPNFVICSFVPRLFDFDPEAVKIPYHHANVDTDEVLFYSAGDFMSRAGSGVGLGSITLHPAGFVHGPQPGSLQRSMDQTRTEETAVMLDAFRPLGLTADALAVSDPGYPFSWARLSQTRPTEWTEALDRIARRADAAGMRCTEESVLGRRAVVARREDFKLRWMATKLYTFVIASAYPPSMTIADLDAFLEASLQGSVGESGTMHGFQVGSAAITVAVIPGCPPELDRWALEPHGRKWAALTFPVLADPLSGRVVEPGRMLIGAVYVKHLRRVVDDVVRAALSER